MELTNSWLQSTVVTPMLLFSLVGYDVASRCRVRNAESSEHISPAMPSITQKLRTAECSLPRLQRLPPEKRFYSVALVCVEPKTGSTAAAYRRGCAPDFVASSTHIGSTAGVPLYFLLDYVGNRKPAFDKNGMPKAKGFRSDV